MNAGGHIGRCVIFVYGLYQSGEKVSVHYDGTQPLPVWEKIVNNHADTHPYEHKGAQTQKVLPGLKPQINQRPNYIDKPK
jgi:hypothetical protein